MGFLFLLVTAFSWGLNWPVLKFALGEWPPFTFRFVSGLGAAALMFGVALARGERIGVSRRVLPRVALAGVLNITSFMGLATLALLWLSATEAAIIAYTMPIWASLLAWPVLGERPTANKVMGLAIGLGGVTTLMAGQLLSAPMAALVEKLPGVGFIMGTALMFACGAVYTKKYPLNLPPNTSLAWQVLIGSLPLSLVAVFYDRWDLSGISAAGWGALGYVVVIAVCLSYITWFKALKLLPASTAAIGTLMVPVIGVLSSGVLLGEPLGVRQLTALAMTVTGVALASRG